MLMVNSYAFLVLNTYLFMIVIEAFKEGLTMYVQNM